MTLLARFTLLAALLTVFCGCGRKTPPIPPGAAIPVAITNLQASMDSQAITLRWSYPRQAINGRAIKKVRSFLVDKAEIPAADYCPGCPVHYDTTITVAAKGHDPGDTITLQDRDLKADYYYIYTVRASSGWAVVSQPSNRVVLLRQSLPLPPGHVTATPGDQVVTLQWQPVTRREDGSPLAGAPRYQILRSSDGRTFRPVGKAQTATSYRDAGLLNGQSYYYQIRAVLGEKAEAHGLTSEIVQTRPLDMSPPLPPRNVTAVRLAQGVKIFWQASPDTDVAGYNIYRRQQGGEKMLIGSSDGRAISFVDTATLPPGSYFYTVTAFDQGLRHNESEHSFAVQITLP